MKIAFLGDISLNDKYIEMYKEGIKPFNNVYGKLNFCDYVVGNLENTCKGVKSSNKPLPKLYTSCETLNYLKEIPVNVVTLANNHIGDNYEEGFDKTIIKLKSENISFLGAGYEGTYDKPLILIKNNIKVALFNFYGTDFEKSVPIDCSIKLNYYDKELIINKIKQYKGVVDFIVLLIHWGAKIEGGYFPDYYMFNDSKNFLESGCDLIIGHHSHTFQPYEKISNKYVFYSLGNFCFANYYYNGEVKYLDKKRAIKSGIPIFDFSSKGLKLDTIYYIRNRFNKIEILSRQPKIFKFNMFILNLYKHKAIWGIYLFYHKRLDWIFKLLLRSEKPLSLIIKDMGNKNILKKAINKLFKYS